MKYVIFFSEHVHNL